MRVAVLCMMALASCAIGSKARADDGGGAVPSALQGVWGRDGRCDVEADRLTITSDTAGWGRGPFNAVLYVPEDRAVYRTGEYDVSNFQLGGTPDRLLYNAQGFNMPGKQIYGRCGADLSRLPWPSGPAK